MAAPMKHSATFLSQMYSRESLLFGRTILQRHLLCCRKLNTESVTSTRNDAKIVNAKPKTFSKAQKISRAMRVYLEKAKTYEQAISEFGAEYESGRRHLANIMGESPDNFTHEDIQKAIRYLLPSALHNKKARPIILMPEDILPLHKVAQFGSDGRPFHFLFYTGRPMFNEKIYELRQRIERLKELEAEMYTLGRYDEIGLKQLNFIDSEWLDYDSFKSLLREETVTEIEYKDFIKMLSRLADHPLNYKEEEFIMKYRQEKLRMGTVQKKSLISQSDGTQYTEAKGRRKSCHANVKLHIPGTGKFSVNGESILYFDSIIHREQIMFPLDFTGKLMEVDVEAEVEGGGPTGQSGAIRHGISKALLDIVDEEMVEKMRQAGLLTVDPRMRERKKPFKRGARKGWTWKAR